MISNYTFAIFIVFLMFINSWFTSLPPLPPFPCVYERENVINREKHFYKTAQGVSYVRSLLELRMFLHNTCYVWCRDLKALSVLVTSHGPFQARA